MERSACRTLLSRGLAALALASWAGAGPPSASAQDVPPCPLLGERHVSLKGAPGRGAGLPFFDRQGRLQGNDPPSSPGSAPACGTGGTLTHRTPWVHDPRVDEVSCQGKNGSERFLVAFSPAGAEVWRRRLGFASGPYRIEERVIGAAPGAIVLSDLAVISPASGETLFSAPVHPVAGEGRTVPNFELQGPALFLASERAFLTFEAEVSLFKKRGGLYRLDPQTGKRDLLLPVATTLLGGSWRVEDLVLDPGLRRLYLAQKLAVRGPGALSFLVYDLPGRRVVCRDVLAQDRWTATPKLTLGNRSVGLSYLEEATDTLVLRQYGLSRP